MTLREVYDYLERIARQVPDIKTIIENDITRLNQEREARDSVFGITQNQHSSSEGWMSFSLNIFFIDRLVNSQDNEVEIQSHAIEVLRAILIRVKEELELEDVRYDTFMDRFQDTCAGARATVTIRTPEGDCIDIFNE